MGLKNKLLNGDVLAGIFGIALSLWWISMSIGFPGGTKDGTPGPGVFPIGVAGILMILSIGLVLGGLKAQKVYFNFKEMGKENIMGLILSVCFFVVFLLLWNFVHYIAASFVMSTGLGVLYKLKPVKAALLGVIFSVGSYYFFAKILMVMLDVAR